MRCRYTEHGYSIFYLSFTVLTLIAAIKARMEKSITALDTVRQSALLIAHESMNPQYRRTLNLRASAHRPYALQHSV